MSTGKLVTNQENIRNSGGFVADNWLDLWWKLLNISLILDFIYIKLFNTLTAKV